MWFLAIKSFLKTKVASYTGVFIGIFIVLISVFLFSNADVILSKFGFETTSNLKAQATLLQSEIKHAQQLNEELKEEIIIQNNQHKAEVKAIAQTFKQKKKIEKTISQIKEKKQAKDEQNIEIVNKETTVDNNVITIPLQEYNQLSESNIDALNEVYDSLFSGLEGEQHA